MTPFQKEARAKWLKANKPAVKTNPPKKKVSPPGEMYNKKAAKKK